ncbi:MAG: tyrosine-type recombinase/integrase [Promicromonosporaceae bacterium]|nr:tyrosine-type recombinase/integrase [Promicromonosporaceae bacterium]
MENTPAWASDLDAWTLAMRAGRLSPHTAALRRYHLERLARDHGDRSPWSLTLDDLTTWTGSHEWGRETARSVRSSLRRFWAWGVATERCPVNVAEGLPPVQPAEARPRPAAPSVVREAFFHSPARVRLMMRLANECGMRRAEVAQVHHRDVVEDLTGWSLRVHGKGSRERTVPLPDDLARALLQCPGFAFPGRDGGHLSARYVGKLVSAALGHDTTMHQLRHLCATEVHDETGNLRLVQTLLGHASLATTQRYVAVRDEKMRAAVASRSLRWARAV